MKQQFIITVEVTDEAIERFGKKPCLEETAYWSATIDNAIESVLYNYRKQRDRLQYNVDLVPLDFTTITAETKP